MNSALRFCREHPVIAAVIVACTALGGALGGVFLPSGGALWRCAATATPRARGVWRARWPSPPVWCGVGVWGCIAPS